MRSLVRLMDLKYGRFQPVDQSYGRIIVTFLKCW